MSHFTNKVVLITGAASGFGAAIALRFSSLDAKLSLVDINWEELEKTGEKCTRSNEEKPLLIEADLAKEDDVKQIIEKTIATFGKLDVLINNAGILEYGTIETTNLQQFDRIFNVNSRAVFYLTHLAIPHLIESKGNIINTSSVAALNPTPDRLVYSLSKAFINHFTKNLALDLAPKGIRVNCVNPAIARTNIYKGTGITEEEFDEYLQKTAVNYPLGRIGFVEDVAKAVTFLASDNAEHITGIYLSVDGGRHLKGA